MSMENWQSIWNKKGDVELPIGDEQVYSILMEVNAWNTVLGEMNPQELIDAANAIAKNLQLKPEHTVLDVGCGCGAVLYAMENKPARMIGVDYSECSIRLAQNLMKGEFYCSEAIDYPVESSSVDGVFSVGVFQYFPNLEYAKSVIAKMVDVLKPNSYGIIADLMDLDFKQQCEAARRGTMTPAEYQQRYEGLDHLYISKQWIFDVFEELGCSVELRNCFSEDYCYQNYTFHIRFAKPALA